VAGRRERDGEREFFFDNLLVRIHFIIVMIQWTGLAPREFEREGDLEVGFLVEIHHLLLEEPARWTHRQKVYHHQVGAICIS